MNARASDREEPAMNVTAYNAMDHAIDLPGGAILPSGERATVDTDDPMVEAYIADAALVVVEDTEPAPARTTRAKRTTGSADGAADTTTNTED